MSFIEQLKLERQRQQKVQYTYRDFFFFHTKMGHQMGYFERTIEFCGSHSIELDPHIIKSHTTFENRCPFLMS